MKARLESIRSDIEIFAEARENEKCEILGPIVSQAISQSHLPSWMQNADKSVVVVWSRGRSNRLPTDKE